jgi:hypothetical protein
MPGIERSAGGVLDASARALLQKTSIALLAAMLFAVPACGNDIGSIGDTTGSGSGSQDGLDQILASRTIDYSAALRIAALRLLGDLPTMTEINSIAKADDASKKAAYEALITDYLGRPAFARQMFLYWRDTFKTGGTAALDTAPAFAAKLSVDNASYMDLFTKQSANCPTFDPATGTFTDAECTNGGPRAGVLTNPGLMAQLFSNLAFRRIRFIQETFDCTPFPAEATGPPVDVGGSTPYTGVWPFTRIASPTNGGGRIDFQDVSSAICAVCHGTLNHQAPLFAYYDMTGAYEATISVPAPLDGAPPAQLTDWLVPGDTTAWRYQTPTPDIPAFGAAMAADPEIAACGVARLWNWALGKTDIIDTRQEVPAATIQSQVDAFTRNGYKIKDLVFSVFTSDDFVKF